MKKLDLKKESFEIVTNEELELVGAAAKTHTTPRCNTDQVGCPGETDSDVTCTESVCYCKS